MINCPEGNYCPTPDVMNTCPAGQMCWLKTARPEITCSRCHEGATRPVRDLYGWIILGLLIATAMGYIALTLMERYKMDLVAKLLHMQERQACCKYEKELVAKLIQLQQRQACSIRLYLNRKRQQEQLERIRPKLEVISRRVADIEAAKEMDNKASRKNRPPSLMVTEKKVIYDARRLFDTIDVRGEGAISGYELNELLDLTATELNEFVRRMNELAGVKGQFDYVSRRTFVEHFLQVLEETSRLTVSADEAGILFDEIASTGQTRNGDILANRCYFSSMSNYLSDAQINQMIKVGTFVTCSWMPPHFDRFDISLCNTVTSVFQRFRQIQSECESSDSIGGLLQRRRSSGSLGGGGVVRRRRPSIKPLSRSQETSKVTIRREDFVRHYPSILIEINRDFQPLPPALVGNNEDGSSRVLSSGIDISFQDLSLAVQLGNNPINVVDHVTGRIRARTMTALMGGSGAGECVADGKCILLPF